MTISTSVYKNTNINTIAEFGTFIKNNIHGNLQRNV